MVRRSSLLVLIWTAGCVTPAITDLGNNDETDVGVDGTDTDVEDSDTEATDVVVDTDDTAGWLTEDTDDSTSPVQGPPLNCHPFDPVSYGSWTRKYAISFQNNSGFENHASVGYSTLPNQIVNNFPLLVNVTDGYAYTVNITNAGSNNVASTYWSVCDHGGVKGAYTIGYQLGAGNNTVYFGAKDVEKYLPKESDMYASVLLPNWSHEGKYKVRAPQSTAFGCPAYTSGTRDVTATYASFGFEKLNIPALGGDVDAYRLNVVVDQSISTQTSGGLGCQIFGSTFGAAFGELFGELFGNVDSETGEFARASFDRWYVRGVGLVKEQGWDISIPSQPTSLFDKQLTQCSGLPNCP